MIVTIRTDLDTIIDYCPTERMVELEYEFCLPKWFWTSNEWRVFVRHRNRLLHLGKLIEEERLEYLRNL